MTPAQRRALDRIHDNEAFNCTTGTLRMALASSGGYPEDSLARGQAKDELERRGA